MRRSAGSIARNRILRPTQPDVVIGAAAWRAPGFGCGGIIVIDPMMPVWCREVTRGVDNL
ncbi:hypothetical protein GCM10009854_20340 [Saccharopolyspora halophila]|uniref:Uncharacterized protein n=1 Tax=Saccharopolyspora halophila TaxID=405551 RepID=A0ABN3G3N4_9PSEU